MFIGTYENKVDRKGRVSVPAPFRQVLESQPFKGIVAFRSYRWDAIEAGGADLMERLNVSMTDIDLFSDEHDDLAFTIFADSKQLPFDKEGRIILPPDFAQYAGISDMAAFVGKGPIFQIWEPTALRRQLETARERARTEGRTISLRGSQGGGK